MAKAGCWICGGWGLMWVINGRPHSRTECPCETSERQNAKTIESQQIEIDALKLENTALKGE